MGVSNLSRSMRRARIGAAALTTSAFLLAGCSGSDSDQPPAGKATVATTTEPTTTQPTAAQSGSGGCGKSAPGRLGVHDALGDAEVSFASGGQDRSYRLAVPATYDPTEPTPVVLNLHGSGSNAKEQSIYSALPVEGAERGYLVITPDAVDGQWELSPEGADDDFLMAVLDDVEADYCVDRDRVFAAGISLGAWKATVTACAHPDRIAAIALVAEEVAPKGCAMPVVAFHGTADAIVPYGAAADDGVTVTGSNAGLPGVEINMPAWATQAGCSAEKDVVRIEPDVEHWTYRGCPAGFGVEFYSVEGGGHTWPGSPIDLAVMGYRTTAISATTIVLDFFEAHPLPGR